jgi:hypothetical protein
MLPSAGSTLLLLVWMANALVNRPDEGGTWDEVRDAGCVHTVVHGQLVPFRPLVAYFLHSLAISPSTLPSISGLRVASRQTIIYLSGTEEKPGTELGLYALIAQPNTQGQKRPRGDPWHPEDTNDAPLEGRANKQRTVRIMSAEDTPDQFLDAIPERQRGERAPSEDGDYEEREQTATRSQELTNLVYSYPVQMFAKAPVRKRGNEAWCRLDAEELSRIGFTQFSSLRNLDDAFDSYISFGADHDKWERTVASLFPTLEESQATAQGLHTLSVRREFVLLLTEMTPHEQAKTVKEIRRYVTEQWVWLPYGGGKNHLWATGKQNVPRAAVSVGPRDGGPWIVLRPGPARR